MGHVRLTDTRKNNIRDNAKQGFYAANSKYSGLLDNKLPYLTNDTMISSLASVIGEGPAGEFVTYIEIEDKLPKLADILAAPRATKVPAEGHIRYAVAAMLPSKTDKTTFDAISTYIKQFGL